ncbi:MAG: hypothetical protein OXN92_05845 [Gammaproteobacteria bacterium]|nr:hypothetical protein [Gammaproteobacteria bacterium]
MQRALPCRLIALGIFVLVGCSESGTPSPTAPTPPPPPPPLTASLSPAADTVQTGQTAEFTLEIAGGDPGAEPAWTCASADTTVASATRTDSGCSATGTGTGTTTIAASVTRGTLTATASASLQVTPPPLTASLSPPADTVEMGQTVDFTLEVAGGDPSAEPAWTCASADTTVASAARTDSGCSATGTGTGTTTIAASVTRGALTAEASASLEVTPPPLIVSLLPAADTVQTGQTAEFTLEITGGDPSAEPAWTCASADATVASSARTDSGCSATGTGTGTTTIAASVTRGALTATASASLEVIPPPLIVSLSPAADTIQTGQTAEFTLEITGGDPNAEAAWTCASADTTVASSARTDSGCSATGTGTGTTTIAASVTRGALTAEASASLEVTPPPLIVSLLPAADTVQTGQTAEFTLEITGGDPSAEPAWTCASADATVASSARTASGCSATGTGTGTTTIAAIVTRGALTATASASLEVIPPPLIVSLSPAADTVQTGQTAEFTLEITGGDPSAEPAWTCASADATIASAARTASGCSGTGTGTGRTTITATVTRGTARASASAILRVAGERDTFAYWDGNGNGDLTCSEAKAKDEGLRLPAYRDNRDGTGLIYEWLERGRSSDSDNDGISCESSQNPNGYVPVRVAPPRGDRMCPSGSPTWMGLPVCEEVERTGYDRDAFGSAYSSLEDEIIEGLPKSGGQVYTPYTCKLFDIRADGTAATDIEHIVALAEAYDSGLRESQFRTFAGDLVNLTIADPTVNRHEKSDRDAAEWRPPRNTGWFAAKVVAVKQKYALSVNPAERDALSSMLASDSSRTVTCN